MSLYLSKCYIVGNHMSWLFFCFSASVYLLQIVTVVHNISKLLLGRAVFSLKTAFNFVWLFVVWSRKKQA